MSKPSSRILSRKLAFLYFYARLFNEDILAQPYEEQPTQHTPVVHEDLSELTDRLWVSNDDLVIEEQHITTPIKTMDDTTLSDDIAFIAEHQLAQHTTSQSIIYDHWFVLQLANAYHIYRPLIAWLIDPYTDKFKYNDMSLTRRAILLLWYTEHKVIDTHVTIIINECVELAKLYEDLAASKLINGVMHQLFEIKEGTIATVETVDIDATKE